MPIATFSTPSAANKRERVSFSKIPTALEPPNLIEVQKESFHRFMTKGLDEAFAEASPIENAAGTMEVTFGEHQLATRCTPLLSARQRTSLIRCPCLLMFAL